MRTYSRKRREDNGIIEDVDELCRLCLGKAEETVPLFSGQGNVCAALPMRIMICLGQQICQEDNVPNAICTNCHEELERYYKFRKKCEDSYIKLKAHVKSIRCRGQIDKVKEEILIEKLHEYQKIQEDIQTQIEIRQEEKILGYKKLQEDTQIQVDELEQLVTADVYQIEQVEAATDKINDNRESEIILCNEEKPLEYQKIQQNTQMEVHQNKTEEMTNQEHLLDCQKIQGGSQTQIDIREGQEINEYHKTKGVSQTQDKTRQGQSLIGYRKIKGDREIIAECPKIQDSHAQVENKQEDRQTLIKPRQGQALPEYQTQGDEMEWFVIGDDSYVENSELQVEVVGLADGDENQNQEETVQKITEIQVEQSNDMNPDIGRFLSAILLELGVLVSSPRGLRARRPHAAFHLETGDGDQLHLQLMEEEDDEIVEPVSPVHFQSAVIVPKPTTKLETPINPVSQTDIVSQNDTTSQSDPAITDQKAVLQLQDSKIEKKMCGAWCGVCGRAFGSPSAAQRHARVHSGARPYACPDCGRAFAQKVVMERHRLVHMKKRPFPCARCEKSFTQRGSLAAHALAHVAPPARPLTLHACTLCDRMFLHASGLSRHLRTHTGQGFSCLTCRRVFNDKSSLLRHSRTAHAAKK